MQCIVLGFITTCSPGSIREFIGEGPGSAREVSRGTWCGCEKSEWQLERSHYFNSLLTVF